MTTCLTLGPTVALIAKSTQLTPQEKSYLVRAVNLVPLPSSSPTPTPDNAGELLGAAITTLVDNLGLKTSLSAWKVPEEDLEGIAKGACGGLVAWGEDKKPSVADVEKLLRSLL